MRLNLILLTLLLYTGLTASALAQATPQDPTAAKPPKDAPPKPIEVTADQSLEWYQDQNMYVARGHAKAVRNDMVVEADLLKAHERESQAKSPNRSKPTPGSPNNQNDTGDIDKMEADGHVLITDPKSRTTGEHATYDLNQHTIIVTGDNLRYETDKQTVTAKDSLEYYEDKKIAVARGHAVEDEAARHIEGDILTAEFKDNPNGQTDLTKVTAEGHVVVVTKNDTARGNHGVYDAARNIAIITGNVQITRPDGTQLAGDVGEVDFDANQSRLLNSGTGRVRALLPQKSAAKTSNSQPTAQQAKPDQQ